MSDQNTAQILAALAELGAHHKAMSAQIEELKGDVKALEQAQQEDAVFRGRIMGYGGAAVIILALMEVAILVVK